MPHYTPTGARVCRQAHSRSPRRMRATTTPWTLLLPSLLWAVMVVMVAQQPTVHGFPNTTTGQAMFAPFTSVATSVVPDTFLSFNFDWNLNVTAVDAWTNASIGWTLDLQSHKLRMLASAMAPANLRIGGSPEDTAEYQGFGDGHVCSSYAMAHHTCLTPARWEEIIEFAEACGLRIVFGLNIMYGRGADGTGSWDPSNARALLTYTATHHPSFKHGFGLGNEKEFVLDAVDTAGCYNTLRATIDKLWPTASGRPMIVGPDLNPRPDWLSTFLAHLDTSTTIDAVSYHMYVGYGRSLDLPSLIIQPAWLDFSHGYIAAHHRALTTSHMNASTQVWITETAAAWASGTAGVCDGFVSGFWWMDQLGKAATDGHSAMCRQCLVGGNYSLLDQTNNLTPNPDYWTGLLFKRLMSGTMLYVNQVMPLMGDYVPNVRGYMSCTPTTAPGYAPGAVTFQYINQDPNASIALSMYQGPRLSTVGQATADESGRDFFNSVNATAGDPPLFPQLPRTEFVLTADHLLSRTVLLNGNALALQDNGASLPVLKGVAGVLDEFKAPPLSYGFIVYTAAKAPACMPTASE
eukprot:m.197685 g.197685  ORF g.197685 m.197685 type:complete len:577 (-) comp20191_c0_seq1:24-1754(-)